MLVTNTVLQNRYLIKRQIGQGGMGAVYEALDQRFDAVVAVKETFFTEEQARRAFEREARLLYGLRHPALPRVIDHFIEDEGQFLVMDFIPGDDLETLRERNGGLFPPGQVLTWGDQMLDALEYLHTHEPPIVHRDIKPQNLKLTLRGEVIILDFGLAKGLSAAAASGNTTGSIFGYTPNYAPLEQIRGAGTDPRSDLYSLAATLYVLMTGVKPPDAITRIAEAHTGQADPLLPASEVNPRVAPAVAAVLAGAMSLVRDQRPASAAVLRQQLREAGQQARAASGNAATRLAPPPNEPQRLPVTAAKPGERPPVTAAPKPEPPPVSQRPAVAQTQAPAPAPPRPPEPTAKPVPAERPATLFNKSGASVGSPVPTGKLTQAPAPPAGKVIAAPPATPVDAPPAAPVAKTQAAPAVEAAPEPPSRSASFSQFEAAKASGRTAERAKSKRGPVAVIAIPLVLLVGAGAWVFLPNLVTKDTNKAAAGSSLESSRNFYMMHASEHLAAAKKLVQPGATKEQLNEAKSHLVTIPTSAPEFNEAQGLIKQVEERMRELAAQPGATKPAGKAR